MFRRTPIREIGEGQMPGWIRIAVSAALMCSVASGCASDGDAPGSDPLRAGSDEPGRDPVLAESPTPPIQLVFDVTTGLYRLVSYPGYYFGGETFYRRVGARWQKAPRLDGPWTFAEEAGLPSGLVRKPEPSSAPPSVPASPAETGSEP